MVVACKLPQYADPGELKRKIRKLKQVELSIRFGGCESGSRQLVWSSFFDLSGAPMSRARYSLMALSAMSREEYRRAVEEYFANVYYAYYRENGIMSAYKYDPAALAELGLPYNAGEADVRKRFCELAKQYHPDTGGDADKFIALMKTYGKLTGR